jgi:hypothetical protein
MGSFSSNSIANDKTYERIWLITNWIRLLLDNIYIKCKCKNIIPMQRVNLGFKVCVGCSKTEKYGCSAITYHKTGNSIQIMSSSDAAKIAKMTQRRGYGTMLK